MNNRENIITKKRFIELYSYQYNYITEARKVAYTIFDIMTESLNKGEDITFRGFGYFTTRQYLNRKCRNPKKGYSINMNIKTVKFKASSSLKDRVNK